eukprot:4841192-Amphidinium_carterae.1
MRSCPVAHELCLSCREDRRGTWSKTESASEEKPALSLPVSAADAGASACISKREDPERVDVIDTHFTCWPSFAPPAEFYQRLAHGGLPDSSRVTLVDVLVVPVRRLSM